MDVMSRGGGEVVGVFGVYKMEGEEEGGEGEEGAGFGADAEFGGDGGVGVEGAEEVGCSG